MALNHINRAVKYLEDAVDSMERRPEEITAHKVFVTKKDMVKDSWKSMCEEAVWLERRIIHLKEEQR